MNWKFLIIDEDGTVTGTNDPDTRTYYAEEGTVTIDVKTGVFGVGQDGWEPIEQAEDPPEGDPEGDDEGEDD